NSRATRNNAGRSAGAGSFTGDAAIAVGGADCADGAANPGADGADARGCSGSFTANRVSGAAGARVEPRAMVGDGSAAVRGCGHRGGDLYSGTYRDACSGPGAIESGRAIGDGCKRKGE